MVGATTSTVIENQLRADDQLVRAKAGAILLGDCRLHVVDATSRAAYRRANIPARRPAPSRFPDPRGRCDNAQASGASLGYAIGALEGTGARAARARERSHDPVLSPRSARRSMRLGQAGQIAGGARPRLLRAKLVASEATLRRILARAARDRRRTARGGSKRCACAARFLEVLTLVSGAESDRKRARMCS